MILDFEMDLSAHTHFNLIEKIIPCEHLIASQKPYVHSIHTLTHSILVFISLWLIIFFGWLPKFEAIGNKMDLFSNWY